MTQEEGQGLTEPMTTLVDLVSMLTGIGHRLSDLQLALARCLLHTI